MFGGVGCIHAKVSISIVIFFSNGNQGMSELVAQDLHSVFARRSDDGRCPAQAAIESVIAKKNRFVTPKGNGRMLSC